MRVNANILIKKLPPYQGSMKMLEKDHDVEDIMTHLLRLHDEQKNKYDRFSELFWQGNTQDTARSLFAFLKSNVMYDVEKPELQTVKRVNAIIAEGVGDCKHYASFINGVLCSLARKGYPISEVRYRFAGYDKKHPGVHHVFAVVKENGKEIWIDPVLSWFNYHKPYIHSIDKTVHMPLYEIGAVNVFREIKKATKKVESAVRTNTANVKKEVKKLPKAVQTNVTNAAKSANKVKKVVLSVNGAGPRNAFLLLLKANAFNIAHRLYDFIHTSKANENELKAKWESMGGNYGVLKNNIETGMKGYLARRKMSPAAYNKQNKFVNGITVKNTDEARAYLVCCRVFPLNIQGMTDGNISIPRNRVGMEPASAAALMTAAAAVIAALQGILQRAKWDKRDRENAEAAINAGAQELSNTAADTGSGLETITTGTVETPYGNTDTVSATVQTNADGTKVVTIDKVADPGAPTGNTFSEQVSQVWDSVKNFIIEYKTPIIISVVGIALFKSGMFGTKKRGKK